MTIEQGIITAVATILAGLTSGGIAAYLSYRATKPKTEAEAKEISVTAELKVSDKWQEYAKKMEERAAVIEARYEQLIAAKDAKIKILEQQISTLEHELERYRAMKVEKAERTRTELHTSVDKEVDALNRDEGFQHEDFKHISKNK